MKNIAVFASGNGTNYEAIEEAILNGNIKNCRVAILVVDKKNAFVIERAKKYGTKVFIFNPKDYKSKAEYETEIVVLLKELSVELICLAGYMRIVGDVLLNSFKDKIINIHPALLPSFKGAHGIEDAFNYGVKVFGVTIHYVSSELDGGKIISQKAFEYYGNNILEVEAEIHEIEHVLYPKTINYLLGGNEHESFN